jgi:hypothetical protein
MTLEFFFSPVFRLVTFWLLLVVVSPPKREKARHVFGRCLSAI